jgi:hypothetical protein
MRTHKLQLLLTGVWFSARAIQLGGRETKATGHTAWCPGTSIFLGKQQNASKNVSVNLSVSRSDMQNGTWVLPVKQKTSERSRFWAAPSYIPISCGVHDHCGLFGGNFGEHSYAEPSGEGLFEPYSLCQCLFWHEPVGLGSMVLKSAVARSQPGREIEGQRILGEHEVSA